MKKIMSVLLAASLLCLLYVPGVFAVGEATKEIVLADGVPTSETYKSDKGLQISSSFCTTEIWGGTYKMKKTAGDSRFYMNPDSSVYPISQGKVKLEMTFTFSDTTTPTSLSLYARDSQGNWNYARNMLHQGYINGGSVSAIPYTKDTELNLEAILDLDNDCFKEVINGVTYLDYDNDAAKIGKHIDRLDSFFFEIPSSVPDGTELCVKSFKMTHILTVETFGEILYDDGSGREVIAENDVIGKEVDQFKIKLDNASTKNKDVTSLVQIMVDEVPVKVSSAVADAYGVIIVRMEQAFPDVADAQILFSSDKERIISKKFRIEALDFGITGVKFNKNGDSLESETELTPSDEVSAEFYLKNSTDSTKNALLVFAAFDGVKVVGLTCKTVSVPLATVLQTETLKLSLPSHGENFSVECYLLDGYVNRCPISKIWSVQ